MPAGRGRRRSVLTLEELIALDERLRAETFEVVSGEERDIPAIVRLINTRRMTLSLPLKFARTEALLARSWPRVHWLLARRGDTLAGCLELRPVEGESHVWEMGSFSQAGDNFNPRVPVKLMTAGFRKLVELGARAAIVDVHNQNTAMWRFLGRLPFDRDGQSVEYPEFMRCRMRLRGAPEGTAPGPCAS